MTFKITEENHLGFNLKGKTSGKIRTTCALCSSSRTKNAKAECCSINLDKRYFNCHHCGEWGWLDKTEADSQDKPDKTTTSRRYDSEDELPEQVIEWFKERSISKSTLKKAGVTYGRAYMPAVKKERNVIGFAYYYEGECVNQKLRDGKKNFAMIAGAYKTLYNVDAIEGTDTVIIQEGEIDVLSSIECGIYNAVSVPNGAVREGKNNLTYLDDIYDTHLKEKTKIILAGDNDVAGKKLHEELAARFGKYRCYTVDWADCKDGNEYLIKYGKEKYKEAINRAEPYPVAGIFVLDSTIMLRLEEERELGLMNGETTHMDNVDERFTWLKKDVIVLGAYNNVGKTEILYNLTLLKAIHAGWKIHVAAFEDKTPEMFYRKLIEMYAGKSLDPRQKEYNNHMSKSELKEAMEFVREYFFFIKPQESFTREGVMDLFSNNIARNGGDIIIIDPVNKLVKEKTHLRDDEYLVDYYREQEIFACNHNVCSVTVTHMNKPATIANGVPAKPSRFNMLGGQAAGNAADEILLLHQPNSERANTTRELIVDKVRNMQQIGVVGTVELEYNYRKRRYMAKMKDETGEYTITYDPFIGKELNSNRTMPVITPNQSEWEDTVSYVPF
jgi:twinkle protein